MTPGTKPVLSPGASYEQTWLRFTRRCHIPNSKSLGHAVSEKNFEDGFCVPVFQIVTPPPRGGASFDPRNIIDVLGVHKEMLYTKYQSSRPSSFREEQF